MGKGDNGNPRGRSMKQLLESRASSNLGGIDRALELALLAIARSSRLLTCCDYDGTLALIVSDRTQAYPFPEAVAALRALAALPATSVAVVSGRSLRDLAALSRLPTEVRLIGSHGTEFDLSFEHTLRPDQRELCARLHLWAQEHVNRTPGASLESKPADLQCMCVIVLRKMWLN